MRPWWRTASIYQIYVRSFADGDGDGTGDLAGLRARLPYLRDLGVDALWLTPWYVSPMADAGYDVADYRDIDPIFGSLADADAMIARAHELGLKVIMIANHVRRPVPAAAREVKDPGAHARQYIDSLGLESPYDYDPFWARCAELKVAVTAHSGSMGWNGRESINSFTYNHIGHFANASHAFAKALILGGVTHRFPQLRFAFLEGGVGWACNLVADLIGHWERRRKDAVESQVRPTNLDVQMLKDLFARYGGRVYEEKMDEMLACLSLVEPFKTVDEMTERAYREEVDDFAAVPAASAGELRRHFSERFYFGCEADDVMTAWAFDKHGNHRLRPIFSSDVGHFDVVDMTEVLEEAYEMVEHGLITEAELREFVFSNPARLHTTMNPDFFKGTVVEAAVAKELAG